MSARDTEMNKTGTPPGGEKRYVKTNHYNIKSEHFFLVPDARHSSKHLINSRNLHNSSYHNCAHFTDEALRTATLEDAGPYNQVRFHRGHGRETRAKGPIEMWVSGSGG